MTSYFQSTLQSAGPQAARIEGLWWVFLWILTAVYVVVMAFTVLACLRGRRTTATPPSERRLTRSVAFATGATTVILLVLLVATVSTSRAMAVRDEANALHIKVTGNQWWWKVEYQHPSPDQQFETANEIHVPVGRQVVLLLGSNDVIHSFWVPSLHGKIDLIPTHQNSVRFEVDRPGTYRGQCAEFCGLQHANMRLLVVAEEAAAFESWRQAQLEPGREPTRPGSARGRDVFVSTACAMCHTIRGTQAGGKTAPDLTHLASRTTIAAGTLPNTRGHLAGWIVDPQGPKPGNAMPPNMLSASDLQSLLDYLGELR
jgi:cytochrome c oxidase subunit 2